MRVKLSKNFTKALRKLNPNVRNQFYNRVNLLLESKFHPVLNNHPVDTAYPGCRSINVTGDYRAIFYEKDGTTVFVEIGKHAQLYR